MSTRPLLSSLALLSSSLSVGNARQSRQQQVHRESILSWTTCAHGLHVKIEFLETRYRFGAISAPCQAFPSSGQGTGVGYAGTLGWLWLVGLAAGPAWPAAGKI